jgi:glycosyltransferase involved in cell wall biosynthesis
MTDRLETPPKVSVVTAFHNRRTGLEDSVRSILTQTFQDFEYIIVDDASTDETAGILAMFHHPRLVVIRNEKNIGLTRSLKTAIAASQGTFIAIHGAGDISFPERLERQVHFLERNPDHVAIGVRVINYNCVTGERSLFGLRDFVAP